ncbi:hypothetical protein RJ640_007164 [Escallonia rubra]|uniref:Uncharacterized protein n=1 Tax=Escallonia rubra TaxID=112253 RepID=A0AA88QRM7_9ASTE|nr:hypothetical protein RJ640_007164 [Escallonia rubra]
MVSATITLKIDAIGDETFRGRDFLGTSEIAMYEPDSDVVRWGLNFLDVDQIFSSTYYGDNSQHDVDICREHYIRDNHHETQHSSIENDEILAHALQEELSHLSVVEEDESSHAVQEHLSAPTGTEDYYYYGHEGSLTVADDMGPSSSCSSPGDKSYDGEEYSYDLEITDEPELDGEVGKRLHHIIPVPHVPRINGDIPSIDEATSDHQRLLDRNGEWGDHVTLQAAADSYGVKIFVITSFKDTCSVEILPRVQKSKRGPFLPTTLVGYSSSILDLRLPTISVSSRFLPVFRRRLQQQRRERHVTVPITGKLKTQRRGRRLAQIQPATRLRRRCKHPRQDRLDPAQRSGHRQRRARSGPGGGGDRPRRGGAGASGGDDGRLGLPEEPLDGLAVGAEAELAGQLEHARSAQGRHPHAPPPAVHLGVAVFGWMGLRFSGKGNLGIFQRKS